MATTQSIISHVKGGHVLIVEEPITKYHVAHLVIFGTVVGEELAKRLTLNLWSIQG